MSDRFSQPEQRSGSPRQNPLIPRRAAPFLKPSLERGIGVVIFLAFGSGALLLANDLPWPIFTPFAHTPILGLPRKAHLNLLVSLDQMTHQNVGETWRSSRWLRTLPHAPLKIAALLSIKVANRMM